MKILGWIGTILCVILVIIEIIVFMFVLALGGYTSAIWGGLSAIALIVLVVFINPPIRASANLARMNGLYTTIVVLVAMIVALVAIALALSHLDDEDKNASADSSKKTSPAQPPTPEAPNLAFFECGTRSKNDRRMISSTKDGYEFDVNGMKIFGFVPTDGYSFRKGSVSHGIVYPHSVSIMQVADNLNKTLGKDSCIIDPSEHSCYVYDKGADEYSRSFSTIHLWEEKGEVYLACNRDE